MNTSQYQTATPESVWAILQETNKTLQETSELQKENEKAIKDLQKSMGITSTQIDNLHKTMGGWANNHGFFAEEYFLNSFENNKRNFFGEKFDKIRDHVKGIKDDFEDEYDILLINGKSIGIVEVKFKAHVNDVPKVLRKAETFKVNFPEYKDHKIYLGLATMAFYPELEQECINEGIAVIKQLGDSVVINDKHLKVF
jgi:hypothetical protein